MNTEIQTFNFHDTPVRTLTDENDEPWFIAKDVANILGYRDAANMTRRLEEDEKGTRPVSTPGGEQQMAVITEPGLYSAILGSRIPEAREFKRWVTHEVLPKIRRTGGYIPTSESDTDEAIMAKALLIAQKTIERNAQQLRAKDRLIKELAPKAKALDDFTNVPDALLVREAAKLLSNAGTPIGEKELREWIRQHGWTYHHAGTWWAASERVKAGHLVMVESKSYGRHKDGTKFAFPPTVRITRKGLALLHKRLGETILNKTLETITD